MRQMAFYLSNNSELHTMYEHHGFLSGRDVEGLTTLGWLVYRIAARDDTDAEFYDFQKQAIEQHYSVPDKKSFMELPDLRVACGLHVRVPSYEETPVIVHIARKQNYLRMPLDIRDSCVLLLDHGVDPYIPGYTGTVPVFRAIYNWNIRAMRILLQHPKFIFKKAVFDHAEAKAIEIEVTPKRWTNFL